jgi:phage tail sheath gpL-like
MVGEATGDDEAVSTTLKLLERARPAMIFVQLNQAAQMADSYGWGSLRHLHAVEATFTRISQVSVIFILLTKSITI